MTTKQRWLALLSAGWVTVYASMGNAMASTGALVQFGNQLADNGIAGAGDMIDGSMGSFITWWLAITVIATVLWGLYYIFRK